MKKKLIFSPLAPFPPVSYLEINNVNCLVCFFQVFLFTNKNVYKHVCAKIILCFVVLFLISINGMFGNSYAACFSGCGP